MNPRCFWSGRVSARDWVRVRVRPARNWRPGVRRIQAGYIDPGLVPGWGQGKH